MTRNVCCPYCEEKGRNITVLKLDERVESAQGSVKCWKCKKGFGWNLISGKVERLW